MWSAKNWASFFKIFKYSFLIFEKGYEQKVGPGFFKICKSSFLVSEKGDQQKFWADFFSDL